MSNISPIPKAAMRPKESQTARGKGSLGLPAQSRWGWRIPLLVTGANRLGGTQRPQSASAWGRTARPALNSRSVVSRHPLPFHRQFRRHLERAASTLPFEVFEELRRRGLRPIKEASAQTLYLGLRLVALDGVSFSLSNTPQITQ